VDTFANLRREQKGVECLRDGRQFTDEFKREAIALLASSGRPLLQIASELGISPSMLRNWRNRSEGRNAGSALRPTPGAGPAFCPGPATCRTAQACARQFAGF
jgi:transposase